MREAAYLGLLALSCVSGGSATAPQGRLLVLGVDGLDGTLVDQLVKRGDLPHLASLAETGVRGTILQTRPILSPRIWTTYASGYPPEIHGILGWTHAGRPFTSADLRTWRIWDAASEAGIPTVVSGWLLSWPATPMHGHMLTERYIWSRPPDGGPGGERPADLPTTTWPPGDAVATDTPDDAWLVGSRLGYQVDATGLLIHPLRGDETAVRHMERTFPEARLGLVYLDIVDQLSHLYWPFTDENLRRQMVQFPEARQGAVARELAAHPDIPQVFPLPDGGSRVEIEAASHWVPDACGYVDDVVGRMMAMIGPEDTLVILSDHGFRPSSAQPLLRGSHREEAFFLAWGAQVREPVRDARLAPLDVGPTLLALAGLPVADDMQGQVRDDLFSVSGWGRVPTRILDRVAAEPPPDLSEAYDRMERQLQVLGYLDAEGLPMADDRRSAP